MSRKNAENYARKINKVCDYIYAHLDDDLDVDKLSLVAGFSVYHFHRQFTHYTGISVAKFVQLLRLKRASYQLVFNQELSVTHIALDAHFENPESFSRAFKRNFSQSPREFRNKPKWAPWAERYRFNIAIEETSMDVKIVDFAETKLAVLQHNGAPELLNDSVARFIQWRKQSQLSPVAKSRTFGLIYNDPKTTAPEEFRFDICGEVQEPIPDNPQGVFNYSIPAGRYAVLRHHGSRDKLDPKVHYLFGEWLPGSGEELGDFPCFFQYLNFFPEVEEHQLVTDIFMPLTNRSPLNC